MEKEILRVMHDPNKQMYKIVKQSKGKYSHGWRRFGSAWYITRENAQAAIDRIIAYDPEDYENG